MSLDFLIEAADATCSVSAVFYPCTTCGGSGVKGAEVETEQERG